jgi:hypothetical protein
MAVRLPTPHELEAVRYAQDEFRIHWESIRPPFPCAFDGTQVDIDALDYLDCEGLTHPARGEAGASLVWGQVIATQMPFGWFFDENMGGLVLRSRDEALTVWPFGRVYQSQQSAKTQFDKYRRLLEWVILQSLGLHLLRDGDRPRALALLKDENSGLAHFVEYSLKQLRELRSESKKEVR